MKFINASSSIQENDVNEEQSYRLMLICEAQLIMRGMMHLRETSDQTSLPRDKHTFTSFTPSPVIRLCVSSGCE